MKKESTLFSSPCSFHDEWWMQEGSLEHALEYGLSELEFATIQELLDKKVSVLELAIFGALFSEHCSYKSTKTYLKTLPTTGARVLQGPGENAGILDIGDGQAVVFKIESHNHPSYIEPFEGAQTGVGGILRDIFTMGARPVALLNSLRFGSPELPKTKELVKGVVSGIGHYGNCVGIPTIGGEIYFHDSYNQNCLVNAFALGIVDHDKIFLGSATGVGNILIYLGSRTGRDGIHGATMASAEFGDETGSKRPTVQVGDPFQEKLLIEACLEVMNEHLIVGIQDMGAAGLTSSIYEMAGRGGQGVRLNLDKVPVRAPNMTPFELMLSESQERMLMVAPADNLEKILAITSKWGVEATVVGEVIEGEDVELYWHEELVSKLNPKLLTDAVPLPKWRVEEPADFKRNREYDFLAVAEPEDSFNEIWVQLLRTPNIASKHSVYEQYDSSIMANTVNYPGSNCGVIRVKSIKRKRLNQPDKGLAITLDCNSKYCSIDPRLGTAWSVLEAMRNIVSVGALPIGISNCLNFGSPEKPSGMWSFAEAIKGMREALLACEIPVISGNVSLYNETKGKSILPTPVIAMVGLIEDVSLVINSDLKDEGDIVLLIGEATNQGLGGSEYLHHLTGHEKGAIPELDYEQEITTNNCIHNLINRRLLKSCKDISIGGLATAMVKCGFRNRLGISLSIKEHSGRKDALLFAENGARFLVSLTSDNAEAAMALISEYGLKVTGIGKVIKTHFEVIGVAKIATDSAFNAFESGLANQIE